MSCDRGPRLTLVTLNGIDITDRVKEYYGINNNWQGTLWKYSDIFGIHSLNRRYYIEYTRRDQKKHWTFGFINNINEHFNPPKITEKIDLEKELIQMKI